MLKTYLEELKNRALKAKDKPAILGPDIDLEPYMKTIYDQPIDNLERLPNEIKENILYSGITPSEENTAGTYFQINHSVVYEKLKNIYKGKLEIMSIQEALEKYEWLENYYGKLVAPDTDKYTAWAELKPTGGYFIRVFANQKIEYPIQSCLYIKEGNISQNVHNIIIVEEGAEVFVTTGCLTHLKNEPGIHIGVSEFFIKKGAKLYFTMIHNWSEEFHVRPRTAVLVEEGGVFINNYVILKPVKSVQSYPTVYVKEGAIARLYTITYGRKDSYIDLGGRIVFEDKNSKGEMVSRIIADDSSQVYSRGEIIGKAQDTKGFLDCRGIILNKEARIVAIPILDAQDPESELSHEAAIGPIAEEEIEYLTTRGFNKDEAMSTITRGFLSLEIPGLPKVAKDQINNTVAQLEKAGL
ncbi:MAG TPA: SufD family Fe-S cluster assembly protein [Dictyoglomaceae bacterium]|nr:SufD family Fe-S cluster assembly protein [Dictyoglomaceae bacterium]HOL39196.1 SufD family Fe-S cluster assembly protein [Dictyoglomaceae bacterium]HOP94195.1 SufD family Fe-S cluster assembly protein [Dictyoglomaceae bacterium]HPP15350.1 SufD family Fe-S cluster assembly protein [Dictyoglomaceae bacterium]HPU43604.1 SufD family Fe-S cluster assembly protein [Dictyoglomaceae bacterium]